MGEAQAVERAAARARRVGSSARVERRRRLISGVSILAAGVLTAACGGGGDAATTTTTPVPTTMEQCSPGLATVLDTGDSLALSGASGVEWSDAAVDLRVFNTTVQVDRTASAASVDSASTGTVCAGDEGSLLLLELSHQPYDDAEGQATLGLDVDGRSYSLEPIPGTVDSAATSVMAVAVPNGADEVELVLRRDGFETRHSLVEDEPVGEQPEILYRDPQSPFVASQVDAGQNLTFTASNVFNGETLSGGSGRFGVTNAALSYFHPKRTGTASAPDRAFIWIATEYDEIQGVGWRVDTRLDLLPADRAQLVLEDGTVVALERNMSVNDGDVYMSRLLGGGYPFFDTLWWAEVPADLERATFQVTPGTVGYAGDGSTATWDGTAQVELSF